MNIILPFQTQEIIDLPKTLYNDDEIELSIKEFNLENKKRFLKIKEPLIKNGRISSWKTEDGFSKIDPYTLHSNYSFNLLVKKQIKNGFISASELNFIETINTICFILFNHGFNKVFYYNNKTGFGSPIFDEVYKNESLENLTSNLDRFVQLFDFIKNEKHHNQDKLKLITSLLFTMHHKSIPDSLFGALGVTILESVFSMKDEKTEIRYRFPLRMTKYLKGNYDNMFNKIKKLYDKRSAYYHTGKQSFLDEDLSLLKEFLENVLSEFITNSEKFDGKEMDKLLLK